MVDLGSKFRGAIIGLAIGDALGMPVEGWTTERIRAELGEVKKMLNGRKGSAGTWTDDTAMTIAVAQSLIDCRDFNAEDMRGKFIRNYDPKRGYGLAVKLALGKITEEAEESTEGQFRLSDTFNGSAMRIAPIGLLFHDDPVRLRRFSYQSSEITHNHILAHEGAALQAYAIAYLVDVEPGTLDPSDFVISLEEFLREDAYKDQLEKVGELVNQYENRQKIIESLGNTVEAHRSVPTAIYSFITHCESFEGAVLYAVNLGGDSDTIGSMTGALSGAYLGAEAISSEWTNKVENASYLHQLADELCQLKSNTHRR